MRYLPLFSVALACAGPALRAQEDPLGAEELKFFESKIRPALVEYCYKCHSADEKIKGGLQLDSREGLRHGGDSGVVLVPGKPEESLLWTAITWGDEDYEMPPKQKLPAAVIASDPIVSRTFVDYCQWHGILIPDDVAVISFRDSDLVCAGITPEITAVALDFEALGRAAV